MCRLKVTPGDPGHQPSSSRHWLHWSKILSASGGRIGLRFAAALLPRLFRRESGRIPVLLWKCGLITFVDQEGKKWSNVACVWLRLSWVWLLSCVYCRKQSAPSPGTPPQVLPARCRPHCSSRLLHRRQQQRWQWQQWVHLHENILFQYICNT